MMGFTKKKKSAPKEEAETLETQEATEEAPMPPELPEKLTPEQTAAREYARAFVHEYDGLVQFGTDGVRANLLMGIFAEQRRTNELLEELIAVVKEGNE